VKWGLLAAAALALTVAIAQAFMPEPVAVEMAVASRGPLRVSVSEDGRTRVADRFVVSAPLSGTLARIELQPGDSVRRGEPVARIIPLPSPLLDPRSRAEAEARVSAAVSGRRQEQAAAARARAAAEQASRDAARERTLLGAGATAARSAEEAELAERMRREELASAEFGVTVADAELQLARAALRRFAGPVTAGNEQLVVQAPVDGRVLRVMQESEGAVGAGTPRLEMGDPQTIEAVVDVLSTDAVKVVPGATVYLEGWGGDSVLTGHVHRVEPSAFTRVSALGVEEQRVNVVVHFNGPPGQWGALGDGYRVEARIVVWEDADVLQVPAGAVFRQGDGWAVYVVDGGRARLRPVTLGQRSEAAAQVLGGIAAGTPVVLYPGDAVRDNQRVTRLGE
jgi:HlyD family secretion protein